MSAAADDHLRRVRADFDQIATFGADSGVDRYNAFLVSLVPDEAVDVLDVGCGIGKLAAAVAGDRRNVVGIDLSPVMIERARQACTTPRLTFACGDFAGHAFADTRFDCIVTAAALHHMPLALTIQRMQSLLRPGGRLIIHDLRRDEGVADTLRAYGTLAHHAMRRFLRTGVLRSPKHVRAAWLRHGQGEHYLSWSEAQSLTTSLLPGGQAFYHWMWRYTIAWNKPLEEKPS